MFSTSSVKYSLASLALGVTTLPKAFDYKQNHIPNLIYHSSIENFVLVEVITLEEVLPPQQY